MNKRFTVEESNLISIFMEEGIDLDVGPTSFHRKTAFYFLQK